MHNRQPIQLGGFIMKIKNNILGALVLVSLVGCGDEYEMVYQSNESEGMVVSAPANLEITESVTNSPTDLIAIREEESLGVQLISNRVDEIPAIVHQTKRRDARLEHGIDTEMLVTPMTAARAQFQAISEPENLERCQYADTEERGSGRPEIREYRLNELDAVTLKGRMEVVIAPSNKTRFAVRMDDNLHHRMHHQVVDGVLELSMDSVSTCLGITPTIYIEVPSLTRLSMSQRAVAHLWHGASNHLSARLSDSARLIGHGTVDHLTVETKDWSVAELSDLRVLSAWVDVAEKSTSELHAVKSVDGVVHPNAELTLISKPNSLTVDNQGRLNILGL